MYETINEQSLFVRRKFTTTVLEKEQIVFYQGLASPTHLVMVKRLRRETTAERLEETGPDKEG